MRSVAFGRHLRRLARLGIAGAIVVVAVLGPRASAAHADDGFPSGTYYGTEHIRDSTYNGKKFSFMRDGVFSGNWVKAECNASTCAVRAAHDDLYPQTSPFPQQELMTVILPRSGDGWGMTRRAPWPSDATGSCHPDPVTTMRLTGSKQSIHFTSVTAPATKDCYPEDMPPEDDPGLAATDGLSYSFTGTLRSSAVSVASDPLALPTGSRDLAALSSTQLKSLAAVERGDRSSVPGYLTTPADATKGGRRAAENALLAGLVVLLLVFPSELFNSTWSKHHERVETWVAKRLPFLGKRDAAPPDTVTDTEADEVTPSRAREFAGYAAVVVGGAVIGGFLDPNFGFNTASLALVIGVLLSIVVVGVIAGYGAIVYRHRRGLPTATLLEVVPTGLIIAVGCVVVSRLVHFQPGYLFGLVGGLAFTATISDKEEGRSELVATIVALGLALLAWIAFIPITAAANHPHPGLLIQVLDGTFAAIFIGGIEGVLFGLTPLEFLPGHKIMSWSKTAWAAATFVTAFLFIHVLLRPETGYLGTSSTASVTVTATLFVAFGIGSIFFWGWFRIYPDPPESPEPSDPRPEALDQPAEEVAPA